MFLLYFRILGLIRENITGYNTMQCSLTFLCVQLDIANTFAVNVNAAILHYRRISLSV